MNVLELDKAPFYHDVARAPEGGQCHWVHTADGMRLRVAHWSKGDRGTVLLFPGRTEYVEKYGPAAGEFARRGFAMIAVDWRGQGLTDRMIDDPQSGHVQHFSDYQKDVAAMLAAARRLDLPRPFYLVAHSMGGAIGLRALYDGLPVNAVAFSAPMWGIVMAPALRPLAWSLSWASRGLGFDQNFAPGTSGKSYVVDAPFDDNLLTSDREMWAFMQAQVATYPTLGLGGPSLRWLYEALRDMLKLSRRPSPALPVHTVLGSSEQIVDKGRIYMRMAEWPGGTLDLISGARHEVMMETPAIRARFYDSATALFTAHP